MRATKQIFSGPENDEVPTNYYMCIDRVESRLSTYGYVWIRRGCPKCSVLLMEANGAKDVVRAVVTQHQIIIVYKQRMPHKGCMVKFAAAFRYRYMGRAWSRKYTANPQNQRYILMLN